MEHSSVGKR